MTEAAWARIERLQCCDATEFCARCHQGDAHPRRNEKHMTTLGDRFSNGLAAAANKVLQTQSYLSHRYIEDHAHRLLFFR